MARDGDSQIELDAEEEEHARRLHEESIVIDGLIPTRDAYLRDPDYRDHLRQGGVTAVNLTVANWREDYPAASDTIGAYRELIEAHSDLFAVAESAADIRRAKERDATAQVLGFQDTRPIDWNLHYLRAFHRMGVRIVQLTYNDLNYVGAGCCERRDPGLSHFGRDLIDEMNDLGMLVDLSHCGDTTTAEAVEYSDDPVAFTHASARRLCPMGRNKTDEQIEALAKNDGVIGVTFFPPLVKCDPGTYEVRESTVHDVLDHIDHVVDLVGVDHVGFGTDMNDRALDRGVTPAHSAYRHYRPDHPDVYGRGPTERYDPFPAGVDRHTKLRNLTRALVSRGYSDGEIEQILGGNFLRLFEDVWGS